MVKYFLFVLPLFLLGWRNQQAEHNIALVDRQLGIGIYVYAVPLRDFDTVCTFTTKASFNSYPGPSVQQKVRGIEFAIDDLARKAIKRSKRKKDINAIVTFDGKTAVGLRFSADVNKSVIDKARVQQYKGYYVFVQNKPTTKFTLVRSVKLPVDLNLNTTGYTSTNKMLDDLIALYEAAHDSALPKANALITVNGIEADFVKIME